ncbi:hypothetical protein JM16_009248, partial [Phytophthora kernoviae]
MPEDKCSLQYQFGDVTPSQACRISGTSDTTKVPQQFHLAFAGEEAGTGMAISWTTFALESKPAVWIGAKKTKVALVKSAKIETKSYYKDDDYELYSYHAVVGGLKPNTEYFYKVGSDTETKSQSTVSSFKTARSSGDTSPFTVAVFGDMGTEANSVASNKYVNSLVGKVDFVYHLGDVSYADNDFLNAKRIFGFFYEEIFNKFMNSLTNVMRQMAYMVVVGNHEAECHSPTCLLSDSKKDQLGNYTAFNARFRMPSAESGGVLNMWYSFEYASVHFTTISSETDYPDAPSNAYLTNRTYGNFGDQLTWLEADLKAADANRENVPWVIVGMHRPIYTLRSCDANGVPNNDYESLNVQKAFEKLFIKYKVDLVYQGHVHAYERHYPTANNTAVMDGVSKDGKTYTNPQAPVHVIAGMAGNSEGLYQFKDPPSPEWLVLMDNTKYGITTLTVEPTKLTVTTIEAATEKDKTIDQMFLWNQGQGKFLRRRREVHHRRTKTTSEGFVEHVKHFFRDGDNSAMSGSAVDDSKCVYKWSSLSCTPEDSCSLQYQFGDLTPSEACRVSDSSNAIKIPQQFHLAFAGEEAGTGMTISWTTFALDNDPAVWLGSTETKLKVVTDTEVVAKSYYKDDDYELYSYHTVVSGLEPNTEYFYRVGSASDKTFQSAVSSFTTARSSGDDSPFTIVVYGDIGADDNSVATNKYVNTLVDEVDFIYHLGDMSYADNAFLTAKRVFGFYYEQVYNKFMNSMTNVMRQMAYM